MAEETNRFRRMMAEQPEARRQPGPTVVPIPQFPDERRWQMPHQQAKTLPRAVEPKRNRFDALDDAKQATEAPPVVVAPTRSIEGYDDRPQKAAATPDSLSAIDFSAPYADVRKSIGELPEEHRKAALDRWADTVVAKEREGEDTVGGIRNAVGDRVKRLATGVLGGWGDRLGANIATLGGADYNEALAKEQALSREAVKNTSHVVADLPFIGKVTEGDLWGLGGGIAAGVAAAPLAPLMPTTHAARAAAAVTGRPGFATGLAGRSLNTGLTGGAVGGAIGYGTGNTQAEREKNAWEGGEFGVMLGGAAPAIASSVGHVIGGTAQAAMNAVRPLPATVRRYSRSAVDRMAQAFGDDEAAHGVPINTSQYGPEGMLADMGRSLRSTTGTLAGLPGTQASTIENRLVNRRLGAAPRISADINAGLGPPVNLVEELERRQVAAAAAAGPHYDQFYNTQIPVTPRLQHYLDFAQARGLDRAAEEAMAREQLLRPGVAPSPNMRLDFIKRQFDRLADHAGTPEAGLDRHAAGQYREMANQFRTEVDRALSQQSAANAPSGFVGPHPSSWAQGRNAAAQGLQFEEGLEYGRNVFRSTNSRPGVHPDELRAELATAPPSFEAGAALAARGQLRDIAGQAAAAYGPNGDIKTLQTLNAPYALEKFAQLGGQAEAAGLGGRLHAEAQFNRTYDRALAGSETMARKAAEKGLPNPAVNGGIGDIPHSISGLTLNLAGRIANAVVGGRLSARNRRILVDMGNMAVSQGIPREQIAYGLRQYLNHAQVAAQARPAIASVASDILRGSQTAGPGNRYADGLPEFRITPHQ